MILRELGIVALTLQWPGHHFFMLTEFTFKSLPNNVFSEALLSNNRSIMLSFTTKTPKYHKLFSLSSCLSVLLCLPSGQLLPCIPTLVSTSVLHHPASSWLQFKWFSLEERQNLDYLHTPHLLLERSADWRNAPPIFESIDWNCKQNVSEPLLLCIKP